MILAMSRHRAGAALGAGLVGALSACGATAPPTRAPTPVVETSSPANAGHAALPACVQATNTDARNGAQQFRFDGEGRLLDHRTFLRGEELARDRYTWSPGKLLIEGASGHIEVTLGVHGEALVVAEGKARSTLVWDGSFVAAKGSPNLEGIYAISAGGGSRHLPQDTTARGIFQRMGAFRFTGKVSVADALGQTVVATYEDGRAVGWETKHRRGRTQWSPDGAPERETSTDDGGDAAPAGAAMSLVSELVYDRRGGRTVATHYRADGAVRDVGFTWGPDGQLAKVESTLSDGHESSSQTVLFGACTEPRGTAVHTAAHARDTQ